MLVFGVILVSGIGYAPVNLLSDISGVRTASTFACLLLGIALLTALGFEFVNGFHDTANAVATVIQNALARAAHRRGPVGVL